MRHKWFVAVAPFVAGVAHAAGFIGVNGAPCAYTDLNAALVAAGPGGTVRIEAGTHTLPATVEVYSNGVTIRGVQSTGTCQSNTDAYARLDAAGGFRALDVWGDDLTLRFLRIENGDAGVGPGGNIWIRSNRDVTFENGWISDGTAGSGGGVRLDEGASFTAVDVTLDGNSALSGGAISAYIADVSLTNVNVHSNSATNDGGGVHCYGCGQLDVVTSDFRWNSASRGGGIQVEDIYPYAGGPSQVSITGSFLRDNTASSKGGAIQAHGTYGSYGVTVDISGGTLLELNTADAGGAISLYGYATLTTEDTEFAGNIVTERGGALEVQIWGSASVDLARTSFETNMANDNFGGGDGGGIYVWEGPVKVHESLFVGNQAWFGGAIASRFEDGLEPTFEISCTEFTENYAGTDGGAIFLVGEGSASDVEADLFDVQFYDNIADDGVGGGIAAELATLQVGTPWGGVGTCETPGTVFDGNTSNSGGGAINLQGGTSADVRRGRYVNNISDTQHTGAAIHARDSGTVAVLRDNLYKGNTGDVGPVLTNLIPNLATVAVTDTAVAEVWDSTFIDNVYAATVFSGGATGIYRGNIAWYNGAGTFLFGANANVTGSCNGTQAPRFQVDGNNATNPAPLDADGVPQAGSNALGACAAHTGTSLNGVSRATGTSDRGAYDN